MVGIIGLVIGLYLVAAIIWALPLPGGSKASEPPALPSVTQPPAPTAQSLRIEVGNGPDFECGIARDTSDSRPRTKLIRVHNDSISSVSGCSVEIQRTEPPVPQVYPIRLEWHVEKGDAPEFQTISPHGFAEACLPEFSQQSELQTLATIKAWSANTPGFAAKKVWLTRSSHDEFPIVKPLTGSPLLPAPLASAPNSGTPKAGLKAQLMEGLSEGMILRSQIPSLFGGNPFSGFANTPKTVEADVVEWEDRIALILESQPRKLIRFSREEKQSPFTTALMFIPPLVRRMDHRLNILEKLIQETN